ncbi:MAG: FKBP-type peptidyl-prolyl cis-trans isomerase [Neisseriaceae bacterium]|nr:FKBP-type peptidyl-prolyl cis-trans isomerase [Neisseriaceae bacterium]MBQ9724705.1 FKBP-type peptidyl-prolyl cis-trans isomerase [Neisseriaceae bacterium]
MTQTLTHTAPIPWAKILFPLLIVLLLGACNREANNNFKNPDAVGNTPAAVATPSSENSVEQQYAEVNRQWLATNAKQDGVQTTASGLQYVVKKEGNGKQPTLNDVVSVKYTGRLIDGTVFDSTDQNNAGNPVTFPLDGVVQGWQEGLQLMKEGAEYTLILPAALGYGEQTVGSIPANSALIFDVALVKVMTMEEAVAEHAKQQAQQANEQQAAQQQPATENPAEQQATQQ